VAHYKIGSVIEAIIITSFIMAIMSLIGILIPQVFRGWGPYLLAGLTFLIVAPFAQMIFVAMGYPQATHIPFINWVGIAIFTGYVAYDWSEALDQVYTLDNAIDASGGLILDAVNLFIRILLGDRNSDD
jgi:FtsH-binding integral membrane protein